MTIEILEYVDVRGRSPFGQWFDSLDVQSAARITVAIDRVRRGLFSNFRALGGGVYERKINVGPGYRIYCGIETDGQVPTVTILLCGGTKSGQRRDIAKARQCWNDYTNRRKAGKP